MIDYGTSGSEVVWEVDVEAAEAKVREAKAKVMHRFAWNVPAGASLLRGLGEPSARILGDLGRARGVHGCRPVDALGWLHCEGAGRPSQKQRKSSEPASTSNASEAASGRTGRCPSFGLTCLLD